MLGGRPGGMCCILQGEMDSPCLAHPKLPWKPVTNPLSSSPSRPSAQRAQRPTSILIPALSPRPEEVRGLQAAGIPPPLAASHVHHTSPCFPSHHTTSVPTHACQQQVTCGVGEGGSGRPERWVCNGHHSPGAASVPGGQKLGQNAAGRAKQERNCGFIAWSPVFSGKELR